MFFRIRICELFKKDLIKYKLLRLGIKSSYCYQIPQNRVMQKNNTKYMTFYRIWKLLKTLTLKFQVPLYLKFDVNVLRSLHFLEDISFLLSANSFMKKTSSLTFSSSQCVVLRRKIQSTWRQGSGIKWTSILMSTSHIWRPSQRIAQNSSFIYFIYLKWWFSEEEKYHPG